MRECIFFKKNIYGYLSNLIDECDRERADKHLAVCKACNDEALKVRIILNAASDKKIPELSSEEWYKFDSALYERITNKPKVYIIKPARHSLPRLILRPVLIGAVFILIISSLFIKSANRQHIMLSESEKALLDEIEILDELNSKSVGDISDEELLEEIELLDSLEIS